MFKLVEACHQSGLTKKAFCQQQGLHPQVFYYWQRKYREANSSSETANDSSLLPLELKEAPKSVNPALEIHYPNGVKVVLHEEPSPDQLAILIKAV
jgi:transposase-like protein